MREIQAVDSEFEGNFSYDNVRAELILAESITDRNHPCASFGWGNKKSLVEKGEDTLLKDLRSFFDSHYSADRTYVVIQTMIPDGKDLSELKGWVTKSFGILENKKLGNQSFLYKGANNLPMDPFANSTDEVIAFNSQRDQNVISFVYLFPPSNQRIWNKSVSLIIDLLSHEG